MYGDVQSGMVFVSRDHFLAIIMYGGQLSLWTGGRIALPVLTISASPVG